MLNEYWRLPVFLWGDEWWLSISSGGHIVITGFPADLVVASEAFVIAAIELMPCLAGSYFLAYFILAIRDCCASGKRKAKCYGTHSPPKNRLVPHESDSFRKPLKGFIGSLRLLTRFHLTKTQPVILNYSNSSEKSPSPSCVSHFYCLCFVL